MLGIDTPLPEREPVQVTIRDEVEPRAVTETIQRIGNAGVRAGLEAKLPRVITREDFMEALSPQGGGNAWQKLVAICKDCEGVPMHIQDNPEGRTNIRNTVAIGSVERTLEWLRNNPQSGQGSSALPKALELLQEHTTV